MMKGPEGPSDSPKGEVSRLDAPREQLDSELRKIIDQAHELLGEFAMVQLASSHLADAVRRNEEVDQSFVVELQEKTAALEALQDAVNEAQDAKEALRLLKDDPGILPRARDAMAELRAAIETTRLVFNNDEE